MDELLCIFHPLFVSTAKSLTGERMTLNFITSKLKSIYDGYANLRMAYEDKNFIDIYICIVIGFINATSKFKQENEEYTYKLFILNNLHFYIHTELRKYITDFYKKTNYISFYQLKINMTKYHMIHSKYPFVVDFSKKDFWVCESITCCACAQQANKILSKEKFLEIVK